MQVGQVLFQAAQQPLSFGDSFFQSDHGVDAAIRVYTVPQQWQSASCKLDAWWMGVLLEPDDRLGKRRVALQLLGYFILEVVSQPFFKLRLGALRDLDEADAGMPGSVGPVDLAFQIERNVHSGKRETKLRLRILGQLAEDADGHAPLAHIGRRGSQLLIVRKRNSQWHLHRMAVIPAPFPHHEIESRVKTARGMQRSERLLQNEVGPGVEGLLGRRLSIHHSEGYGLGIALSLTERAQEIKAVLQVIAVYDDCVELALRQQIVAGSGPCANLDIDRDLLQRRTQHVEQAGIVADEKRV